VRHELRSRSDCVSRKRGSVPVVPSGIESARGLGHRRRVMSTPSDLWLGASSSTLPSVGPSSPPSQVPRHQDLNSNSDPELRMRRLVLQAENRQLSRAPQTISPLSPLRNPNPGLDAPFWNSNPTLYHYNTRCLNKSDRYREAAMSPSGR
jgi:hypothetical protein